MPGGSRPTAGHHRVAFRVGGTGFLQFLERAKRFPVFNDAGQELEVPRVVDHKKAISTYFCDPYGNRFEITTYDADEVRPQLEKIAKPGRE